MSIQSCQSTFIFHYGTLWQPVCTNYYIASNLLCHCPDPYLERMRSGTQLSIHDCEYFIEVPNTRYQCSQICSGNSLNACRNAVQYSSFSLELHQQKLFDLFLTLIITGRSYSSDVCCCQWKK